MLIISMLLLTAGAGEPAPVKLHVYPAKVQLSGLRGRQNVSAQAEYADGSTRDVSFDAKLSLDSPVAKITAGQLAPLSDGTATLTVAYGGLTSRVPVSVTKAKEATALRFRDDIMPALTHAGCNSGKCH